MRINFFSEFLQRLDKFIVDNYQNLKCDDVFSMYIDFFNDLKEFKGNSNGFTGFSEFLIFRFMLNQLGGSFKKSEVSYSKYLFEFENKSLKIRLGQSTRLSIGKKRYYPDILIYHENKLMGIIQIKIYLTHGCKEIRRVVDDLEPIKQAYPEMRALLIIFYKPSKNEGKVTVELHNQKKAKNWFSFLILQKNDRCLSDEVKKWLCM